MMQQQINYHMCPKFEKAFYILGKKWNGLLIDVLLSQPAGVRFSELASCVNKCSDRVVAERLRELEANHIVKKVKSDDGKRYLYQLSEQGKDLASVINQAHRWAEKWIECR